MGIPTNKPQEGESYSEDLKFYITDPSKNQYGIEYLRFTGESVFPDVVQFNPHFAVEVNDIEEASKGFEIVVEPLDAGKYIICFAVKENTVFELMQPK